MQIAFLRHINADNLGATVEQGNDYYEKVAMAKFPNVFLKEGMNNFFNFLANRELVVLQDGCYYITEFGKEFLQWIALAGVNENKAY